MGALGGLFMFVGLAALVVAVIGLVRQRVAWTRVIATRRDAGFLLLASLVIMFVGAMLVPSPNKVTVSSASAVTAPTTTEPAPAAAPTTSAPTSAPVIPAPREETTPPPEPTYSPVPAYTAPVPDYSTNDDTVPSSSEPTTGAYNGGGDADTYTNVDGDQVERPDSSSAGASAKCADGSYSHSRHRSGTCSGHGGVAQELNP